ncbi:MAG: protein translocase subunit SecF, partial [Psittacicella sp.]
TGGTTIETTFSQSVNLPKLRHILIENGLKGSIVQPLGGTRSVMIRIPSTVGGKDVNVMVINLIKKDISPSVVVNNVSFEGPQVGKSLSISSVYATLATLAMLLIYVGFRFEWRLGLGAVLSLAHDVTATLGVFAFLQWQINLTFVAAILSVVGYSLNDSIVVFDRVRENFRKMRKADSRKVIDVSLTQTLSRTIMTSVTTLLVSGVLFFLGGSSLHTFSLALLIGIGFGTYSSIYIAIALAFDFKLSRNSMVIKKDAATESL